ncbi:MAG TPA: chorismate synthase [Desulfomonilia bacterium]
MLTFYTAGESHGRGIFAFLDGIPAGLEISKEAVDNDLARRQMGYGRGGRMKIEKDKVDVLSGIRGGITLGSPVLLAVWNVDFENWKSFMDPFSIIPGKELYTPRPGHADLSGAIRFGHKDLRNVLERSSARETAGRVAAGGFLRCLLKVLGIEVYGFVTGIGKARFDGEFDIMKRDASSVFCPDPAASEEMEKEIEKAIKDGDTLGGNFRIEVTGLPAGIGSSAQWDKRLDTMISAFMMSIPAIKAVQIGKGTLSGEMRGSVLHDEIYAGGKRGTNNAGGIEGGISNGENIIVTCTMKPIPTLIKGLNSIDIRSGAEVKAQYERSDYCAVPAASVAGEAMMIIAIARAILNDYGQANIDELKYAFDEHRRRSILR